MRVGLLADTHDRLPAIAELVRQMQAAGVGMVLHAGDYCSPFALRALEDAHVTLAGVFGRNDGDREGLVSRALPPGGIGARNERRQIALRLAPGSNNLPNRPIPGDHLRSDHQ